MRLFGAGVVLVVEIGNLAGLVPEGQCKLGLTEGRQSDQGSEHQSDELTHSFLYA